MRSKKNFKKKKEKYLERINTSITHIDSKCSSSNNYRLKSSKDFSSARIKPQVDSRNDSDIDFLKDNDFNLIETPFFTPSENSESVFIRSIGSASLQRVDSVKEDKADKTKLSTHPLSRFVHRRQPPKTLTPTVLRIHF